MRRSMEFFTGSGLFVACVAVLGPGCGQSRAATEPLLDVGTRARHAHLLPHTTSVYGVVDVRKLLKEAGPALDYLSKASGVGSRQALFAKVKKKMGVDLNAVDTITVIAGSALRSDGRERKGSQSAVVVVDSKAFDPSAFKSHGKLHGARMYRLSASAHAAALERIVVIGDKQMVETVLAARAGRVKRLNPQSLLWQAAQSVSRRHARSSWAWFACALDRGRQSPPLSIVNGLQTTTVVMGPGRTALIRVRGRRQTIRTFKNGLIAAKHLFKSRLTSLSGAMPPGVSRTVIKKLFASLKISSSGNLLQVRIRDLASDHCRCHRDVYLAAYPGSHDLDVLADLGHGLLQPAVDVLLGIHNDGLGL